MRATPQDLGLAEPLDPSSKRTDRALLTAIVWHKLHFSPIAIEDADIGRRIIYRRHEAPPLTGVITTLAARRVFVRLGSRPYNLAVSPVELDLIEPHAQS
jgi:hypothetical protein